MTPCKICGRTGILLPYETPNDSPMFDGGNHCQDCEDWLRQPPVREIIEPGSDPLA